MSWLIQVLKSRSFLIGLGIVFGLILWLVVSAWFDLSVVTQLVGVIVFLAVCVTWLFVHIMRANRSADAIEQSIRAQAEHQLQNARPDRRAEIEQLRERLEASIDKLKKSKLGRGRGRAALYALPWYLFIGPPGSGKTTAIANSGLNFPMGIDRVRGVGGTRDCDWFFSDNAILLDTAGRYMTEEDDTEEWYAFLDTLKEHRPDRPINGVIVGISANELADASRDEVEWHADNIRRRLDELITRLGVRFPVYVVFTKCDLIQGFVDFFGELTRREREQVWGATVDVEEEEAVEADHLFGQEFDRLYESLLSTRTVRLGQSMKREERHKVFVFPHEVEAVKEKLQDFVGRLFRPNPYQETPVFRGFYFTSGTQEGAPINRVIRAIADKFDLPATQYGEEVDEVEAKSYFIKDVFKRVIIPDQFLVQQTSKAATRGRLLRAGSVMAAIAALVLFVLGTSQAIIRTNVDLNRAQEAASEAALVHWEDTPSMDDFERMERLREEVALLERRESRPPLLRLGLYRGSSVLGAARSLYDERMNAFMDDYALTVLEDSIATFTRQSEVESDDRDRMYEALRAYLLLTTETARLEDEVDRNFLTRVLAGYAAGSIEAEGGDVRRLEPYIEEQSAAFVSALHQGSVAGREADDHLIARTRDLIYEQPSISRVYQRMKQEGEDRLRPFTLADALQGRSLDLFDGEPEVSGFFTMDGLERFVLDRIEEESEDPTADDWVMGREEGELPADMLDSETMERELWDLYFQDYASAWQRFLRQVRYRPFADLTDAARGFERLSDPSESPILYLMAQVTNQTQFATEGLDARGVIEGVDQARGFISGTPRRVLDRASRLFGGSGNGENGDELSDMPVDRRFAWLHDLNATEAVTGTGGSALVDAINSFSHLRSNLESAAQDPADAADMAASVLDRNGGELAREMRSIRASLGRMDADVRRSLFDQPIQMAWAAVLASAQEYLNERWHDNVYQPYQISLADQYPVDINSSVDIPINDFESFFRPNDGVLDEYFDDYLSPFVRGRDLRSARTWEGRGIQVSTAAARAFERADAISEALYTGDALRFEFELRPDHPEREEGAPSVGQVSIEIHGRDASYAMGSVRPWTEFVWPERSGARLSVSTRAGGLAPKVYEGDWAWFKMFQDANINRLGSAQYDVRWAFDDGVTVLYQLRTGSSTNPFNDIRSFFNFQPPERLN